MRRLLLCCLLLLGCRETPTRERVLAAVVEHQLVPDMAALAQESAALTTSLQALQDKPAEPLLQTARQAWRDALMAWERVYAFRIGPIVDNSGLLRSRFWPVREPMLRALLNEATPLTPAAVEELGIDVRGMYALEWLLFDASDLLLAEPGRARQLALLLSENVQRYVDDATRELADGAVLTQTLSSQAQETVSRLVNQMSSTVETLASDRLAVVLEMHAHKNVRAGEVMGAPSKSSRELALAQLRATERLYVGADSPGLSALVLPVAPQIDERVRARFQKARTLLERVDGPLELVVGRDRPRMEDAFRALKELEVALKVDLASALGVTMTFTAGDGD